MKKIFTKKYMIVFEREEHDEYVVYNTKKEWRYGHTHIHTYKQALYLVDCVLQNKIPHKVNRYFLVSLYRVTSNKKEQELIKRVLDGDRDIKDNYHNTPKNYRK